jgi:hypothetical protein
MAKRWFGQFELPENTTGHWQIGPYRLWLQRNPNEIKVASFHGDDPHETRVRVDIPAENDDPLPEVEVRRFGFDRSVRAVTIAPALADRAVVVSPQEPLHLPPRERVTLYISTPIWVQVSVEDARAPLVDEPTLRPTDTWFGPSTMKGELCYATKTAARLTRENLPVRPYRVVSEVDIRNRSNGTLTVEHLRIPFVHLSVYVASTGDLWTEPVTFDHVEEENMASVRLGSGPPAEAAGAVQIAGPRSPMDAGLLIRTFGRLVF